MSIEAVAWAFKQPVKPAAKKFVLVALADNADTYGISFPSYRHIAEKTSLDKSTVIRHCKDMVKEGLIEKAARIRGDGSDTSNAYRLPIIKGCIDDHPLSLLFKSEGVAEYNPPVAEYNGGVEMCRGGGVTLPPQEPSFNHHLTKKEKKPLSRIEFMRVIDGAYKDQFYQTDEFGHLTESELKLEAEKMLDFYGAKNEWPTGEPSIVLRHWLRNGIARNKIRKAPAPESKKPIPELEELKDWQRQVIDRFGQGVYTAWFGDVELKGDILATTTRFKAEWIEKEFGHDLRVLFGNSLHIQVSQQEKEVA